MLELSGISFAYEDKTQALSDVSLCIRAGTITGVIGANGAGKSTLLQCILGLLKPQSGTIRYRDRALSYKKKELRDYRMRVNMVIQDVDQQIFFSRVYDEVAFALRNRGVSEDEVTARVTTCLRLVGMEAHAQKAVHMLSYGQRKRIALASVLVMECELLLLDEVTAGLDPQMTREMKRLLRDVKERGTSLLLCSHDMDFIYELCDYVYILDHGRLILEGPKDEIFLNGPCLEAAGLAQPWLVKLHRYFGLPLYENEEEALRAGRKDEASVRWIADGLP